MNIITKYGFAFGLLIISIICVVFFYPVFWQRKVPLNANFLVSFYYPYRFEKLYGFPTGVPTKQGGGYDTIRIGYPYVAQTARTWKNLKIPLWNSYNFSGLPLASETQTAAYYPLYIFSLILSEINLWTLFTISGFALCFLLTYLYLKNLTANTLASIFGAFTFSFSTFFIVWNQEVVTCIHTAAYLPLILLGIDLLDKNRKKGFLFILSGSALMLLAAYTQVALYVLILAFFYAVWRKKIVWYLLAVVLSGLLTLFQYLPLWEMYRLSSRTFIDMKPMLISYLLPYYSLIQLFIPNFFGNSGTWNHYGFKTGTFYEHSFATNLPAVILVIYGLFSRKNKDKHFFLIVFFVTTTLALNLPISKIIFYLKVPVLSTSIANRILFLPAFCIAILASLGIKDYLEKKTIKLTPILLIASFFFSIGPVWALLTKLHLLNLNLPFPKSWTNIALRNSLLAIAILVLTFIVLKLGQLKPKLKFPAILIIFTLSVFQIFYFFQKTTAFSPRNFVYPNHPVFDYLKNNAGLYRFTNYGSAFVENNLATVLQIYSPEGYDSLAYSRYAQFLKAAETNAIWTNQVSRSDAGIDKGNEDIGFDQSLVRKRILTLTSTKYILYRPLVDYINERQKAKDLPPQDKDFKFLTKIGDTTISQYLPVLSRATLIPGAIQLNNNQQIFDKLFSQEFKPNQELVLEEKYDFETNPDRYSQAKISDYQADKISINTQSKTNQWLLLTDSYYPGWNAYIDGKLTKIYRANFTFRAIPVPAGNHTIIFDYQPDSFKYGLIISLTTFLGILFYFFTKKIHSCFATQPTRSTMWPKSLKSSG